jgi:hypothetical protein
MLRKSKETEPEPEFGELFRYFSGLSVEKQGICFVHIHFEINFNA